MISFNSEQKFIVTGASSGIGEGIALLLNKLGASVVAIARNRERLESVKAKAENPQNLFCEIKDLADDVGSLPNFVKSLREKYGKFSGMVASAGVFNVMPLRALDVDTFQNVFKINYFAPVMLAKGLSDKRNNVGRGTSIVAIASSAALMCDAGMTVYSGSKAALVASMKSLAREVAPAGIRVNCVSPSLISTGMADEQARAFADGKYPMGIGKVEDVANTVVFLLSSNAGWTTGQNYVIDCASF